MTDARKTASDEIGRLCEVMRRWDTPAALRAEVEAVAGDIEVAVRRDERAKCAVEVEAYIAERGLGHPWMTELQDVVNRWKSAP